MNALRGWGVAFLGYVAVTTATPDALLSPTTTLTILGLTGTLASVIGNEAAIRIGRQRLITCAMIGSAACATLLGYIGTQSYMLAVGLMLIYGPIVWLDSSSLTAAQPAPLIPRDAVRRSQSIPCSVTSADSWGRLRSASCSISVAECRPQLGQPLSP